MIIYFISAGDEVVYIGQTKLTLEKRRKQHEYNAGRGKGYVIGAAIRKHGAESFTWNVHSSYYNQVDLDAAEKHYIQKYNPKYNINLGGEARGVRKKSGAPTWNKGKKGLQQAWNKGLPQSEETRKKLSLAKSGKPTGHVLSEKHKQAIASGRREKYRATNRPFICSENNKVYHLVVDAAKDLGIPANGIYAVLNPRHKMKSYKGFTFKYL